jgi:class 3 adenylate cyclase
MQETGPVKRRLTAILAADAVGYSARMGKDEEGTLRTLAGHRRLIDSLIADHGGRVVGTAGDSVLAEFGSSVEAVRCAVEIQEALATRNESLPEPDRLHFRIGINLGDVIVDGVDILGDGVNVASRLEGIADPGGICIASSVFDQISGKLNLGFEDIGKRSLKNIGRPVRAYRLLRAGAPKQPRGGSRHILMAALASQEKTAALAYTSGMVQARCQRPDGSLGPFMRARVQVVDGEVIIAVGEPGLPGSVDLRGRPAADGTLVLDGFVLPGAGRARGARGTQVASRYEGRLTDGRGMLTGHRGAQRCSLGLQLK